MANKMVQAKSGSDNMFFNLPDVINIFETGVPVPKGQTTYTEGQTLPIGKYLIFGYCQFSSSSEAVYNFTLHVGNQATRTVRASMFNGGGTVNIIAVPINTPTKVFASIYQNVPTTVNVSIYIQALRIG